MEEKKVSVIMSAYNVEATIAKAIKSVLNQTYKNFELIVIEDCSTDSTLNIIKSYKDKRLKLVKHTNNLGCGRCRYDGLKKAKGDYIAFLDSDDWYAKDNLETLVNAALASGADIVSPGYCDVIPDGRMNYRSPEEHLLYGDDTFYIDRTEAVRLLNPSLCKKELWDKVGYCKRKFIEDLPTFVSLLYYAESRYIIPYVGYYKLYNSGGLVNSASPYKIKIFDILQRMDIYNFFRDKEFSDKPRIKTLFLCLLSLKDVPRDADYSKELKVIEKFFIKELKNILYNEKKDSFK